MKRVFRAVSLLSLLALCIGLLPVSVLASVPVKSGEVIDSGVCGDDITWEITSDHALILSGTGEMWDYDCYDCDNHKNTVPWSAYYDRSFSSGDYCWYASNYFRSVVVGEGITYIGSYAFRAFNILRDVQLPSTLEHIGAYAFEGCTRVETFVIPSSVTEIDECAFGRCYRMTSINIPDGITKISDYMLWKCTALEEIVIPDSVTEICRFAFQECTSLKAIDLPESIVSIGYGAFGWCSSLKYVKVPPKAKDLAYTFQRCYSLETVVLPNVTRLYYCFYNCDALRHIYYPGSKDTFAGVQGSSQIPPKAKLHTYNDYTYLPYCSVSVAYSSYAYTGNSVTPKVTVKTAGGTTLKEGVNYTVSYTDNVDYGAASVVVTGIGKYRGTNDCIFTIKPGKVKGVTVNEVTENTISVSFQPVLNASKYYIKAVRAGWYVSEFETTDTTCLLTGLMSQKTYKIRIRAIVNSVSPETGETVEFVGNFSDSISVMTK